MRKTGFWKTDWFLGVVVSVAMLDTECASVRTGAMDGDTGVTCDAPTPAAVAPISTILS